MGNGKYINDRLELFTEFSKEKDILNLINMLENCFGLSCSKALKNKKSYVVIISGQSLKLFHSIVFPYIIPNMKQKIGIYTDKYPYQNNTFPLPSPVVSGALRVPWALGNNKGKRLYSTNSGFKCLKDSNDLVKEYRFFF